jgi:hypothetical protein
LFLNIVIADIHFRIRSGNMPLLNDPSRKTYGPFIADRVSSGEGAASIDITIEARDFPNTGQLIKIFETPDSWSMFRDGDQYFWMDISASLGGKPDYVASFHRRPEKVTVYCGESFVTERDGKKMLMNPIAYPLDQLLLMYALAEREGACMHAAALDLDGKGYLFPGRSGAGKSTIARSFTARNRALLSDDRVVVRKIGDKFRCFGTPWAGDAGIAENRSLPLNGIFFIHHGNENRIETITPREAFERLMPVTSIPWYDDKVMPAVLSFCEDLALHVPAYVLHFTPDRRAADLIEGFVSDNEIHGAIP